jgi:hypothetical protein
MGTKKKKPAASKKPRKVSKPPPNQAPPPEVPAPKDLEDALGNEAAYLTFLPAARKLAVGQIRTLNGDPMLAKTNIQRGVGAVLAQAKELEGRFSKEEIERVRSLPDLALAVTFAVAQIGAIEQGSDGSLAKKMTRARHLRRVLLKGAEACAESGDIPAKEVQSISAGRGQIDTAQDCVQLAALYRKHREKLAGKTPATPEMLAEAAALGSELVGLLQTSTTRKKSKANPSLDEALDHRDRLWTLLEEGYELAWKMGALLWGRRVEEYVPPMLSRIAKPSSRSPSPPA